MGRSPPQRSFVASGRAPDQHRHTAVTCTSERSPRLRNRPGERGSPPGRLRPVGLHTLGCPTARLVLRGLFVVARRAQRTEPRERVRIFDALGDQRTARLGEVVGNGRRLAAQHAPRVRVQVTPAGAFPLDPVSLGCGRPALLLRFLGVLGAASAGGQFRAAGYRARGRGLRGTGTSLRRGGVSMGLPGSPGVRDYSPGFARGCQMVCHRGRVVS